MADKPRWRRAPKPVRTGNAFRPRAIQSIKDALAAIPERFTSDGLSGGFPDWMFKRWKLTEIDWPHAHWYCTRCWPAGTLDHRRQHQADENLEAHANERLPWWLGFIPFVLLGGVTVGGHASFNTCYAVDPLDVSEKQRAKGLCRHSMPLAGWQRDQVAEVVRLME